ncbi:MAG: SGNH/GDSL hydrolase family protein [Clostridia bacterium]|nr:SGNH/GDSL hydrolase family protein [Clostridia bacterium]
MVKVNEYLTSVSDALALRWPQNRAVNIVCHGHSVPAGYFATPFVNTFSAYPHLLHRMIKERFPYAVTNVIVTAIGGENSVQGAERFEAEVLSHRPDVLSIDYSLNDRKIGLAAACTAWESMICKALERDVRVILCTPTWDNSYYRRDGAWEQLQQHAEQVRALAEKYEVGLADSFKAFSRHISDENDLPKYLSHGNHPTQAGHMLVAEEIARYFIAR